VREPSERRLVRAELSKFVISREPLERERESERAV
jgi:hypothetical protein